MRRAIADAFVRGSNAPEFKSGVSSIVVAVRAAHLGRVMSARSSELGVLEHRWGTAHRRWSSTERPGKHRVVAYLERQTDRLPHAVLSNKSVVLTLGVVAADRRISYLQAYDLLRVASRRAGRTVHEIAADVSVRGVLAWPEAPSRPPAVGPQSPHRPRSHWRPE